VGFFKRFNFLGQLIDRFAVLLRGGFLDLLTEFPYIAIGFGLGFVAADGCRDLADAKRNEWNLLLDQYHALAREGSDSIEDIFDLQFRRRFSKLIDKVSGAAWRPWDDREQ
jgi:hypothetical protein